MSENRHIKAVFDTFNTELFSNQNNLGSTQSAVSDNEINSSANVIAGLLAESEDDDALDEEHHDVISTSLPRSISKLGTPDDSELVMGSEGPTISGNTGPTSEQLEVAREGSEKTRLTRGRKANQTSTRGGKKRAGQIVVWIRFLISVVTFIHWNSNFICCCHYSNEIISAIITIIKKKIQS
jgi:hypothetical protein